MFKKKNEAEVDDASIYSSTSSVFSSSSRMSKIPNAVKSSFKYFTTNNKRKEENNLSTKRHTTFHFSNLFNRQKEAAVPTSTTSSTLFNKDTSRQTKRRNSSVVTLTTNASKFLSPKSNNNKKQDEDGDVGSLLFGKQVDDLDFCIEESLLEDSKSEKASSTVKKEEPWTRQRAKSCQESKTPMLSQLASKNSNIDISSTATAGNPLTSDLPLFQGLVTTTLTTLHTRLTTECDKAIASALAVENALPQNQLTSIISDLRKMVEMVNWDEKKEKKDIRISLNDIEKSVLKEEININSVKDQVTMMKQIMNQCICQYYKVVEKAIVIPSKGYRVEGCNKYTTSPIPSTRDLIDYSTCKIDHMDPNAHWYRTYFLGADDTMVTFFGYHAHGDPIMISIKVEENKDTSTNRQFRIIYRTKKNSDQRKVILDSFLLNAPTTLLEQEVAEDGIPDTTWKSIIESSLNIPFHQLQKMNQSLLVSSGLQDELLRLDENSLHIRYKFGVLLIKQGQTREEDWFSNESTDAFMEFLNIIGKKIRLQGYTGWAAGLDTKSGDSGEYTFTNVWNENILAYHVSTLIPSKPGDRQQIQRKRHIGNDIVCIVFVEGNQPFNPAAIKSQFLHVFIVVHGEVCNNVKSWTVEVVSIKDVPTFGPPLPQKSNVFYDEKELEQFLLAKLVNAEYAAFKSPKFAIPMNRAREGIFTNLVEKAFKTLNEQNITISTTTSCTTIASSTSSTSSPRKILFHTKSASTSSSSQSSHSNSNVIPSPSKSSQAIRELSRRRSAQDLVNVEYNKKLGSKKFTEGSTTRSQSEQDLIHITGKNHSFKHRAQHLLTSIPRFGGSSQS